MQAVHTLAGFSLLEHTADIGIEAWGPTLGSLFEQTAQGLRHLLIGPSPVAPDKQHQVQLEAEDIGELLVTWLNEVIFLFETRNLVPGEFRVERVNENELHAVLHTEAYTPKRHVVEHQVKAATYHQLFLKQGPDGWHARIYLDL